MKVGDKVEYQDRPAEITAILEDPKRGRRAASLRFEDGKAHHNVPVKELKELKAAKAK